MSQQTLPKTNIFNLEKLKTQDVNTKGTGGLVCLLFCLALVLLYVIIYSPLQIRDFPLNKNTLHLNFPGKTLVRYHRSYFGCPDYATNGLGSALSSSSADINGWLRHSHSTKVTAQITTRAPSWKGLWATQRDLRLWKSHGCGFKKEINSEDVQYQHWDTCKGLCGAHPATDTEVKLCQRFFKGKTWF